MYRLRLLITLALRSLASHKTKSLIVGALLFFGAFLVTFGTALLDNVERSMQRSITSSLAGHVQLYSSDARDEMALFGGAQPGAEDIGQIENYAKVKAAIEKVPNVKALVPMGLDLAFVSGGNDLDRILDSFRAAVKAGDQAQVQAKKNQVIEIARLLETEWKFSNKMANSSMGMDAKLSEVKHVTSEAFWTSFAENTEAGLTYLETKLAPMIQDGRNIPLRYVGTDLETFAANFDRFEIVDGEPVPKGKRGFLFNKKFYEEEIKHKVARDLDHIRKMLRKEGKTIASDPLLKNRAAQLARLHRTITFQLDTKQSAALDEKLKKELPQVKGQLTDRVKAFLTLEDATFERRYKFFYDVIAPMIQLYDVRVGDILTVRALTSRGQLKAVNVKVYGTFRFKGLDKSDLAGGHNLMDLMTFRDLYDLMTKSRKQEIESLRRKTKDATSENADDVFFGGGTQEVTEQEAVDFDEFAGADMVSSRERQAALLNQTFSKKEIEEGVVRNIAVILKDPTKLQETLPQLAAAAKPFTVQAVSWQKAAGIVGQFINLVRMVLTIALLIVFLVALVIINNAMITATMERISEIGTLRAIGATKRFVLSTFLIESLMLGLLAGGAGAVVAGLLVAVLGSTGISANDSGPLIFFFAGPRLFPSVAIGHLMAGLIPILFISLISTLYPALIATRVQPLVAMQVRE